MIAALPSRAFCWYGDDFTGSTDVLEAMAPHMPAVLFLRQPTESEFAPFAQYMAFGLAGWSRSETPEWMDAHLPEAFNWLRSLGAAICLYKVCSTFDSSPRAGNIGRAMEIGRRVFQSRFVPVVPGAPSLRRYTYFGHLFAAAADGAVHRIDRHPGMMRHPVTPMDESDLRAHLARQTPWRVGLLDAVALASRGAAARYIEAAQGADAVLVDVAGEEALAAAGRLLWDVDRQPFVTGSSGAAYALLAHWIGEQKGTPSTLAVAAAREVDRLVVLSGSCSPGTALQIGAAERDGYGLVAIHPTESGSDETSVAQALAGVAERRGVILYTSRSESDRVNLAPDDRRVLGERAGRILQRVLAGSGVRRAVIAGGDTSSHAGRQLGITALTFAAPLAPGAPLCRAWPSGLELVFKGGQCGQEHFFEAVRRNIAE